MFKSPIKGEEFGVNIVDFRLRDFTKGALAVRAEHVAKCAAECGLMFVVEEQYVNMGPMLAKQGIVSKEDAHRIREALDSVSIEEVHAAMAEQLHHEGFVEVWLFQNDGRFALKTLALPQRRL